MARGGQTRRGMGPFEAWHGVALWLVLLLAGLLVAGGIYVLLRRPPAVDVATVRRADVDRVLAATGRVTALRTNRILSPVPGRLFEVRVDEGDRVEAGELLARVEDREARAALDRARAALGGTREELAQARRDLERMQALGAQGAVSDQEVEAARLAVERLVAAEEEARATVETARSRLEDHEIEAAFPGRVLVRFVDPGQQVGPETPLFEIGDDDPRVALDVDERYRGELRVGLMARGAPPSDDEALFELTVAEVAPRVDPETGTTRVELVFDTAEDPPPFGATLDVNLVIATHDDAVVVPRRAVMDDEGGRFVLVVEAETATRRAVRIIDWPASWVVVLEGLRPGEEVVLDPRAVTEGERVRPRAADDAV